MFRITISTSRIILGRNTTAHDKLFWNLLNRQSCNSIGNNGFKAQYRRLLRERPLIMQGFQTAVLMALGDVIAQFAIEGCCSNYNLMRTLKFSALGLVYVGPSLTIWYKFIDSKIKLKKPVARALTKVAVDQIIFAPIFIVTLIAAITLMQFKPVSEIPDKLKADLPDVLKANYVLWPMVQLVNFGFVPLQYQVLVVQIVSIFWNTFIAWRTYLDPNESKDNND